MEIHERKILTYAIFIILTFGTISLFASNVSATSGPSSWEGYLPASDAVLNQTVGTSLVDETTGMEMALAADMWTMKPAGNTWDYTVRVGGTASSRKSVTYSFNYGPYKPSPGNTCNPIDWYGRTLPNVRNLGDDEGVLLNTPLFIWYYGTWYSSVWVSENGWLSFDRRATNNDPRWGSPSPPASFPSSDPAKPDIVLAPFWTDLHGGEVRWGSTGAGNGYFDIAWVGVRDASNYLQYFSVSIRPTFYLHDRVYSEIRFFYCQVQNTGSVVSGIENQVGTQGVYTGHPASEYAYYFDAGTSINPALTLWTAIKSIKITAHKYYSDSNGQAPDDPTASVLLRPSGDSNPPVVGGNNVEPLSGSNHHLFTDAPEGGSAYLASEALTTLAVEGLVDGIGYSLIAKEVWDAWTMVWPSSTYQEATTANGQSTAFYRGGANNEPIPDDSSWNWINWADWEIGLMPTFHWILDDPAGTYNMNKVHYLAVAMEIEIVQLGCTTNCKTSVVTSGIVLTWHPYVIGGNTVQYLDWFARTIPNRHTYTFRPLYSSELPSGVNSGYHLQSEANGEIGYKMLGWGPLTGSPSGDYPLDAWHRIAIDGYFRKSEASSSVNMYVIGHYTKTGVEHNDNLENVVQTIPVLSPSDGTGWIRKSFVVDLGASYPYGRVKLAIGRTIEQGNAVLAVDWAGVSVTYPVYLSIGSTTGGSTNPSPGTYSYYPGTVVTVTAQPQQGVPFAGWELDGIPQSSNPITITMGATRYLNAFFGYKLGLSYNYPAGRVTFDGALRTPGNYYYLPGGTVVTAYAEAVDPCYFFKYWFIDGVNQGLGVDTITVTMNQNHGISATFAHVPQC